VQVDLLKESAVERALDGVSCVVHCAQGSRELIVEGTRNVMKAALKQGVARVVHFSSTVIYGNATGEVDEKHPFEYTGNEYADAKIDAEQVCAEFSERGLPIVILRPPLVYGPYSTDWTVRVTRQLVAGDWGPAEKVGNGKCNLVFVDDLFRMVMRALEQERAVGEAFNVNGPEIITWNDYFQRIRAGLELPEVQPMKTWKARLKVGLMAPVAAVGGYVRDHHMQLVKALAARFGLARRAMKLAERRIKGTPSPAELDFYSRDVVYTTAKAREVLGFVPHVTVDEGLKITNAWVRAQGLG
jgi:nucleoside-diphosphate-sugar epimerase